MNKPIAWWTGKYEDEGEDFIFPDTRQAHVDHPQSETHTFFPIPLYTAEQLHPVKEPTWKQEDEDRLDDALEKAYGFRPHRELTQNIMDIYRLSDQSIQIVFTSCRSASEFEAILRKAQEK